MVRVLNKPAFIAIVFFILSANYSFVNPAWAEDSALLEQCGVISKRMYRACEKFEVEKRCLRLSARFSESCAFENIFGFPRGEQLCAEVFVGDCKWGPYEHRFYIQSSLCAEDSLGVKVSSRKCLPAQ